MLHRVQPNTASDIAFSPNAHLSITPTFLDALLQSLSGSGYEFVDLDEAKRRIISGEKTRKFIAITLDDGYKDNAQYAAPVFEKYKAPFTIFVAPGLVDGRATLWWEDLENIIANNTKVSFDFNGGTESFDTKRVEQKSKAFETLLSRLTTKVSEQDQRQIMKKACKYHGWDAEQHQTSSIMDWSELKAIAANPLCSIGAHTIHHYAVARLSREECELELSQSAKEIEAKLGVTPTHFAYPYGYPAAAGERDFEIAKLQGFETALTTRHGVCFNAHNQHLTALPRISINGNFQKVKYVKALLSGAPTFLQNRGRKLNVS